MSAWPEVQLGEICQFRYGKSLAASSRDGGRLPVYGSNGVVGHHSRALTDGPTIVIGRKGSFGEVNYSEVPCWPIDTTYYVDAASTDADLKWLSYRLQALGLKQLNKAAAIPGLNREDAYRQRLLLPTLTEQRRIAAILGQADALLAKRRHVLSHLDDLTQSIFHDMFESRAWPTAELSQTVRVGTIVTYGIVQAGPEFHGGIPYIRTGDIVEGRIRIADLRRTDPATAARFDRSAVRSGDIVMSIRATVGTTAVVPPEIAGANLTQGTARIAPGDQTVGTYLLGYLRSEPAQRWIQAQVKGATFREITLSRLRQLPVPLPPLELQRTFSARVEAVEAERDSTQQSLAMAHVLFASLQSRAFRGEL